jgi:hypothetical protein
MLAPGLGTCTAATAHTHDGNDCGTCGRCPLDYTIFVLQTPTGIAWGFDSRLTHQHSCLTEEMLLVAGGRKCSQQMSSQSDPHSYAFNEVFFLWVTRGSFLSITYVRSVQCISTAADLQEALGTSQ